MSCDFEDFFIVEDHFDGVQHLEQTASANKLCQHIEVVLLVDRDSHVEYDVRVPQLVEHFDLFNEVLKG